MTTVADARLAFQHFLGHATPPLDSDQQACANVADPINAAITPADVLCIFQHFLGFSSCLDSLIANAGPDLAVPRDAETGTFPPVTLNGNRSVTRQEGLMFQERLGQQLSED